MMTWHAWLNDTLYNRDKRAYTAGLLEYTEADALEWAVDNSEEESSDLVL